MSVKEVVYLIAKGSYDSIKGIYLLFTLDSIQRQVHQDLQDFQELKTSKDTKSISKSRKILTNSQQRRHHGNAKEEPRLINRVVQCCALNGFVFGLSIIIFNHLILPALQFIIGMTVIGSDKNWYWLQCLLKWTFDSLWVLPLFLLSRIVNALWFQDIGNLAYRYSIGRPKQMQSLSTFIADYLFSVIIQVLFLLQAMIMMLIPLYIINDILYIFHISLLYSFYSFEYKWIQMGWQLNQRLVYLETNWLYFFGFGLPLTILTWLPENFIISGCLFSILFPLFIISGNEGTIPSNTALPQLHLFSPVVSISNLLFQQQMKRR